MDEQLYSFLKEQDVLDFIGYRILLVDDEPDNLFLLKNKLEQYKYEVHTATSGDEGLLFLGQNQIDLIIADQKMPNMDGLTFCKLSRKLCPDSISIMLTAYSDRDMLLEAISQGNVFRVMTKPWDIIDIIATIKEASRKLAYQRAFRMLVFELKQKNEKLEVSYRQIQKMQEEKIRAERLATLGQVTARFIHEINNQLSVMVLLKSMRDEFLTTSEFADILDLAIEATENVYQMVDALQQFTRGTPIQINKRNTDIRQVVQSTMRFIKKTIIAQDVTFEENYNDVPQCEIDPLRIKQVLLNILRNAINALQKDRRIWISIRSIQDRCVEIAIRDQGKGIPEEHKAHIFKPFYSISSHQGLGLGLEICRQIIEQHQGTITFETQVNKGTTFYITLPVK